MFASILAAMVATLATITTPTPVPMTIPPTGVAAGAPWVDPDDQLTILDTYGETGLHVLCTGDYTGTVTERAVLGEEDSAAVAHIFRVRDYYGIAYGDRAC